MNDSNWTGRWNRTARDAYGHSLQQEPHLGDKYVGLVAAFVAGFLTAMIVVGAA